MKKSMLKKLLALGLATVLSAALLTGCGGSSNSGAAAPAASGGEAAAPAAEAEGGAKKDTLVILSSGAFQGEWDPTKNTILSNKHLEQVVHGFLVMYDKEGNLYPGLAEEWHYLDDGYTLEVKIKEGLKFHDGTDFTTEDVAASIVYASRPESTYYSVFGATSFTPTIIDDYTIQITPDTKKPVAPLVITLAYCPMLSSEDIEADVLNTKVNGLGAYKFVKYENETVFMDAFDGFYDEEHKAKVPHCQYKYMAEASTRLAALQTGEADFIERVDIEQVPTFEGNDSIVCEVIPSEEIRYIVYKCTQGVMADPNIRKAIACAIDRETIVNDILQGYGVLAEAYTPHTSNVFAPADLPSYDPEKAKEYLAAAGYPNGEGLPTITYISSTGLYPKSKEIAEYIVSNLEAVGFKIDLTVEETAAWETHLYQEDSCMMTDTGWMNVNGDGDFWLSVHFRTQGRVNFSGYPEIDDALTAESQMTDPEERVAYIKDTLNPLLVETNTLFPLYDSVIAYGYSADLTGVEIMPNSCLRFGDIGFK